MLYSSEHPQYAKSLPVVLVTGSLMGRQTEKKNLPSETNINIKPKGGFMEQLKRVKSLLRYMIPMFLVYLAEYLINQGLLELIIFDCSHSYGNSPASQYRWYQVMYQAGAFISRSSLKLIQFNMTLIALMPLLQVC
ncbi:unnamed protein product [Cylicostephanus goldi]|uniref:Battenin n=1 Tax=Cylicostephanus goldi TaxID=71465 RepID=A0A3P7MZR6_CYLGO|nr:unnamed protein product [Cylicostephanus goldi]